LEAMYGLGYLGQASNVLTITNIWQWSQTGLPA